MPHALHAQTPSLQAIDGRGLVIRHIDYHRVRVDERAQARIEQRRYDLAQRPEATWDPRLFARLQDNPATRPNLSSVFSLSGTPLAVESVDAGWQVSLFGEAGQLLESWDARGSHWLNDYDQFLRPSAVHEQSEGQAARTSERFSYADCSEHCAASNSCGRLIRRDDGAGSAQFQAFGINRQPLKQTRRFLNDMELPNWPEDTALREALLEPRPGLATQFVYGPTGDTLSQTDALGNRQAFAYDVCGQNKRISLTPASASEQVLLSDLSYNAYAQLESQTAGNGVLTQALFDPADGRLQELLTTRPHSATLQHLLYEYDPVGNLISIADRAQPTRHFANQRIEPVNHYEHDSLYQLIKATGRETAGATIRPELPERINLPLDTSQLLNYTQHYRYDEAGNLFELRHEGAQPCTHQMIVDLNSNRSLPWSEGEAPPDFTSQFDANGNLQMLAAGRAMRWDARNHLLEVNALTRTDGDCDRERYAYDADGMRLRKSATAQAKTLMHTCEVRYLPGLEIRTNSANRERLEVITLQAGRAHVRYLHWTEGEPEGMAKHQVRYSVDDHLGSISLELDDHADLISHEGYYPYGGTAWWAGRSAVEAKYKVIRYSGKERDCTGLYYYGQRYYAPWWQRWINPDPASNADGLNPYIMVMNNPITLIDPDGNNGVIPNEANWIWLGKPLPAKFAQNINKFVHENPHYSATLWTDKTSWAGGHAEALENLSKRVNINRIELAFHGIHYKLEAAFERERSGPLNNYAAASDIARPAILNRGGIYMDVDVQHHKPLPINIAAPENVLIIKNNRTSNAILAATPNSAEIRTITDAMIINYHRKNEHMWKEKRMYSSQLATSQNKMDESLSKLQHQITETRFFFELNDIKTEFLAKHPRIRLTVESTGPGLWAHYFQNPTNVNFPKTYHPIDASAASYLKRPAGIRRASI